MYQKDAYTYAIDYARKFWHAYRDERKVFMINFLDMHEGTYELIPYIDKPLASLLREIDAENTTIMIMADHGPHLGGLKMAFGLD
jgi:phosphopentomutase